MSGFISWKGNISPMKALQDENDSLQARIAELEAMHDHQHLLDLADEMAKLQAENAKLKEQIVTWHKYPDEKPESNGYGNRTCLVAFKDREFPPAVGWCDYYFPVLGIGEDGDGLFGFSPREGVIITHWACLPEPPEEEK